MCSRFQADLDATAARCVFTDMPWLPSEMKAVADAVRGCDTFPENPDEVYRLPPATTPP